MRKNCKGNRKTINEIMGKRMGFCANTDFEKGDPRMKDQECIKCANIFECKGKPSNDPCVNYSERKETKDAKKEERKTKY